MNDIYLFEKQILIKEEVQNYLGKVFYQMSALAPHDF
jgi:WASH complex subunit 7